MQRFFCPFNPHVIFFVVTCLVNAADAKELRSFVEAYCIRCHGAQTQKGDRRFDTLKLDPRSEGELELWKDVLDRVNLGDMPPAESKQPNDEERVAFAEILSEKISDSSQRIGSKRLGTTLRRLNRIEYDRSMRSVLSLHDMVLDLTGDFPPDESVQHFRNIGSELVVSDFLMSRYVEAANQYLGAAESPRVKPEPRSWSFKAPFCPTGNRHDGKDKAGQYQHVRKNYHDEGGFLWLKEFASGVPISGYYRIRVRATGIGRDHPYDDSIVRVPREDPIRMQVVAGAIRFGDLDTNNSSDRLLAEF